MYTVNTKLHVSALYGVHRQTIIDSRFSSLLIVQKVSTFTLQYLPVVLSDPEIGQ